MDGSKFGISLLFVTSIFLEGALAGLSTDVKYPCVLSSGAQADGVTIAGPNTRTIVIVDASAPPTVHLVVNLFMQDVVKLVPETRIAAVNVTALDDIDSHLPGDASLIFVGLASHPNDVVIQAATKAGANLSLVTNSWEAWTILPTQGISTRRKGAPSLLVAASDRRGLAYAFFRISQESGVTPWYWWADIPIRRRDNITIQACHHGPPAVKYRGLFLNDEQPALTNWTNKYFHTGEHSSVPLNQSFTIDFYGHVFELLLRLKGNLIWGAMWDDMFAVAGLSALPNGGINGTGAAGPNQILAELYGTVYGTSHEEPMARNTPEFDLFAKEQTWDFVENRDFLTRWWTYGADRAKSQETLFSVGMRGRHDVPLEGASASLLEDIVATQQNILTTSLGKPIEDIPTQWCLYSEVLKYYDFDGLTVPDSVTLLWADDNHGSLRRVPTAAEQDRAGGNGLYFHMDYHGGPRSYQWLSTVNLVNTWEQIHVAQAHRMDRIFVVNIGDLKPIELGLHYALDLAYDGSESVRQNVLDTDHLRIDVSDWLMRWCSFHLPGLDRGKVAHVLFQYNALNNKIKPESVNASTWSLTEHLEAERVETEWQSLNDTVQDLRATVPDDLMWAFEQLVAIPALLSGNLNQLRIASSRANLYAAQGRSSTKLWHDRAVGYFKTDVRLTNRWNALNNGKWIDLLITPHISYTSWNPPPSDTMPDVATIPASKLNASFVVACEESRVAWYGKEAVNCDGTCVTARLPVIDRYSFPRRWFDIASATETRDVTITVAANETWLQLSAETGHLDRDGSSDIRVFVTVDWEKFSLPTVARLYAEIVIQERGVPNTKTSILVAVDPDCVDTASHSGAFIGANGLVAMHASNATKSISRDGATWYTIEGYGMTGRAMTTLPPTHASFAAAQGPSLEFAFYLVGGLPSIADSNNKLSIAVFMPSLFNYHHEQPHQYTLQVDNGPPLLVQPVPKPTKGALQTDPTYALGPPDIESVLFKGMRVARSSVEMPATTAGWHTLALSILHPGLVIEMVAIGRLPGNISLPPLQSYRVP